LKKDGIFNDKFFVRLLLSLLMELRILKIGQRLGKLWRKVECSAFYDSRSSVYHIIQCMT